MSTNRATAATQIDAHIAALADQIDHRPRVKKPAVNQRGYRVLLVVTGSGAGPTADKTAAAAAARAKLDRGRRGGSAERAA